MRRGLTILLTVLVTVAVLGVVFVRYARSIAGRHEPIEAVAGAEGIFRARNMVVDLYAARTAGGAILFDAGVDSSGVVLDALLGAAGSARDRVQAVFITHGHQDHVTGAALLRATEIYVGAEDAELMQGADSRKFAPDFMAKVFDLPGATATQTLNGRTEIQIGADTVLAIPFPGHTPGSTLYLYRGVLFVGDTFNYANGHLDYPPGVVTEDMALARASIAQLPQLLTGLDVQIICTGHGGCTPPGEARRLIENFVAPART